MEDPRLTAIHAVVDALRRRAPPAPVPAPPAPVPAPPAPVPAPPAAAAQRAAIASVSATVRAYGARLAAREARAARRALLPELDPALQPACVADLFDLAPLDERGWARWLAGAMDPARSGARPAALVWGALCDAVAATSARRAVIDAWRAAARVPPRLALEYDDAPNDALPVLAVAVPARDDARAVALRARVRIALGPRRDAPDDVHPARDPAIARVVLGPAGSASAAERATGAVSVRYGAMARALRARLRRAVARERSPGRVITLWPVVQTLVMLERDILRWPLGALARAGLGRDASWEALGTMAELRSYLEGSA